MSWESRKRLLEIFFIDWKQTWEFGKKTRENFYFWNQKRKKIVTKHIYFQRFFFITFFFVLSCVKEYSKHFQKEEFRVILRFYLHSKHERKILSFIFHRNIIHKSIIKEEQTSINRNRITYFVSLIL